MGRPREFDTDVVINCVLNLFWREGYDGAGVADLKRATGVGRKGLYNTFGGKQGLFREALNRYVEQAVKLILAPLEAENAGRADIEQVLRLLSSPQGQLKENRGCLVCLTAESAVTRSAEIGQCVQGYFQRLRNGFANALRGTQTAGDLAPRKNPEVVADFLVGTVMGLSAMARAGRPREQIRHYIETALSALG